MPRPSTELRESAVHRLEFKPGARHSADAPLFCDAPTSLNGAAGTLIAGE